MNELAKIQLTKNPYLLALRAPRLAQLPHPQAMVACITLLTQTYTIKGEKMESEEVIENIAQLLLSEIENWFAALTVEEIKLAFAKGVRRQYGEFFGLNIATYHQWLRAFQTDDARLKAKTQLHPPEPEPDKTRISRDWWQMIIRQHHSFKATGVADIYLPLQQFRKFEDAGLIIMDKACKERFIKLAEKRIKETPLPPNRVSANALKAIIAGIATRTLTFEQDAKIKSLAAQLAIEDFYNTKTEKEFEKLILKIIKKL